MFILKLHRKISFTLLLTCLVNDQSHDNMTCYVKLHSFTARLTLITICGWHSM